MSPAVKLSEGVVVEQVGQDMVVLVHDSNVVTLTGQAADVVGRVVAGEPVDASSEAVAALVDAGVLSVQKGLSRRSVVRWGVVAGGVGVSTLALPSVAAAASPTFVSGGFWFWKNEALAGEPEQWNRLFQVILQPGLGDPDGLPSNLQALGTEFPFQQSFGEDRKPIRPTDQLQIFFYTFPILEPSVDKVEPLTGPITGTFTWDGVTYEVTFIQQADAV